MKQRIFSRGKGWYIPCKNYKDENDKTTFYVNFKKGEEPRYLPPEGQEWCFLDIDIESARFECFNGKSNMKVWSYTITESKDTKTEEQNREFIDSLSGTPYEKKFGGSSAPVIDENDLPFY